MMRLSKNCKRTISFLLCAALLVTSLMGNSLTVAHANTKCTHEWIYKVWENNGEEIVTASCNKILAENEECDWNIINDKCDILSIAIDEDKLTYGEDILSAISLKADELSNFVNSENEAISTDDFEFYKVNGSKKDHMENAPYYPGEYEVRLTVSDNCTIHKAFTIDKRGVGVKPNNQKIEYNGQLSSKPEDISFVNGSTLASGDVIKEVKITGNNKIVTSKTAFSASDLIINNSKGEDVTDYYDVDYIDGELTVIKANPTLYVFVKNWEYGDDASVPTLKGNVGNAEPIYTYYTDDKYKTKTSDKNGATNDGEVPTLPGTYWMKAVVPGTDVSNSGSSTTKFSITNKKLDKKMIKGLKLDGEDESDNDLPKVYFDDKEHVLSFNKIINNDIELIEDKDYTVTGDLKATKAGKYSVTVTAKEGSYYTGSVTLKWEIATKKNKTLSGYEANGYTGCPNGKEREVGVILGGESLGAKVKYGTEKNKYITEDIPKFTEGRHVVYYEISKDGYDTVTGSYEVILEHKFSKEFTVDAEATCEEDGFKSRHCIVDGCNGATDKTVLKAIGHDYESKVVSTPTCTSDGLMSYTCKHDKTHRYTEPIPKKGHDFSGEWTVTKEATKSETGRREKSCKNGCGEKLVEEIPALNSKETDPLADGVTKDAQVSAGCPVASATINNSKSELLKDKAIFSEEDLNDIKNGKPARVWLEIGEVSGNALSTKVRDEIKNKVFELYTKDARLSYFDASLYKKVGDKDTTSIHKLENDLSITINVPERYISHDDTMVRSYYIGHYHDNNFEILDCTYDAVIGQITFKTKEFSPYVLIYCDELGKFPLQEGGSAVIKFDKRNFRYKGSEIRPNMTVWYTYQPFDSYGNRSGKKKKILLKENIDYIATYTNNIEVGVASVTITGIGDYAVSKTKNYYINKEKISKWKMSKLPQYVADGTNHAQSISENLVVYDGKKIVDPSDYIVIIKGDTTKAGKVKVSVSANINGHYRGKCKKIQTIKILDKAKVDLTGAEVEVVSMNGFVYKGAPIKAKVKVRLNGKVVPPKNYNIVYKNNVDAGVATCYVVGKGKCAGISKEAHFTIEPQDISKAQIKKKVTMYWRESIDELRPVVSYRGVYLGKDVDYVMEVPDISTAEFKEKLVSMNNIPVSLVIRPSENNKNFVDKTGKGLVQTLKISKRNIKSTLITNVIGGKTVSENGIANPKITVKYLNEVLTEDVDYKVTKLKVFTTKNGNIKKVKATVTGIGIYKGKRKITWTLEQET